jgi:DNA-binding GntR family transcriptional regulator
VAIFNPSVLWAQAVNQIATAQQQAYIYLQDQIVSGELGGGSRLHLESISNKLGISRMPVREAIRQLDAEGYVTIRPNRGAVVTSRTREEVIELFEIRAALEGLATRLAVPFVTQDAIEDLKLELVRLRRIEFNSLAWIDRHDQFHDSVCQISRRPRLCAEVRRLRLAIKPYLRLYTKIHARPELKGYEHEHILAAMESGDAARADEVMRVHIMANAEAIANCLPALREEVPAVRPRNRSRTPAKPARRPAVRQKTVKATKRGVRARAGGRSI